MVANYQLKHRVVVAMRHTGGRATVISNHRGEQHANAGDWMVMPENPKRGEIEVLTNEEFQRLYEPITE